MDADQAAELEAVRIALGAPTLKDAVVRAVRLVRALSFELGEGKRLVAVDAQGGSTRIVIPDLEGGHGWRYLCERPHAWRRQLWVKGRKLLASTLWQEAEANGMTAEQVAEDRDLPVAAVREALLYSAANQELIRMEAEEERRRLLAGGVSLDP